jgi:hypothetical protein
MKRIKADLELYKLILLNSNPPKQLEPTKEAHENNMEFIDVPGTLDLKE